MNVLGKDLDRLMSESKKIDGICYDMPRDFQSKDELNKFYKKYGYVSIKNLLPLQLLQAIREDLINLFQPHSSSTEFPLDSAILNLDDLDKDKLFELHTAANKAISFGAIGLQLKDVFQKLSGVSSPVLQIANGFMLGIAKDKRLVYDFHQESSYMKGFDDIFNVHYPLLRTSNVNNGTMSILPGTHKFGPLTFDKKRLSNESYTDLLPTDIESIKNDYPELHCYLELGDCVIFHKDLIHKSNYNGSSLCRPVGVSRFTQSSEGDWVHRSPDEL